MSEQKFCFMNIAEVDYVINNTTPKNTRKNTSWSIATWDKWATAR